YPITWPLGLGGLFHGIYHRLKKEVILYRKHSDEPVEVFQVEDLDDPRLRGCLPAMVYEQAREEIELLETALEPFSQERFLKGEVSPVTFGSAKQNFGVDTFLDFFTEHAPGPSARKTEAGVVQPLDHDFTGFVFKIQAN